VTAIHTDTPDIFKSRKLLKFIDFQASQRADDPPFLGFPNVSEKTKDKAGDTIGTAIGTNQAQAVRHPPGDGPQALSHPFPDPALPPTIIARSQRHHGANDC